MLIFHALNLSISNVFHCLIWLVQAKRQQAAVLTRSPGNGRSNQLADFNTKESRERREAVSQYYRGHDITESAQKQSVRFKAGSLLYLGRVHVEESDFLVSYALIFSYSQMSQNEYLEL